MSILMRSVMKKASGTVQIFLLKTIPSIQSINFDEMVEELKEQGVKGIAVFELSVDLISLFS
jgi:tryptophan synthase alpha subunit